MLWIDQHKAPFRALFGYFRDAAYEAAPVCARPFCRDRYSLLAFHAVYCTKYLFECLSPMVAIDVWWAQEAQI